MKKTSRSLCFGSGKKNEDIRYRSSLLLHSRSRIAGDVYAHWDTLYAMIKSGNSYHRACGLTLMAENARWDTAGRLDAVIGEYLSYCDDEKPMVVRLCIQALSHAVEHKPKLYRQISDRLMSIDLMARKETQRKLLLQDILGVLVEINKREPDQRIKEFIDGALAGGWLSSKEKREIQSKMA